MTGGVAVLLSLAFSILSTHVLLQPSQLSTTETNPEGTEVTLTGFVHFAFVTPACSPKCKIPSVAFPFLMADGENYRLLGRFTLPHCQNEEVTVTGWLHAPSEWASKMYTPPVTFAGDLTIVSYVLATTGPSQTC